MNRKQRRVVCAALRLEGILVLGPRHYDLVMQDQFEILGNDKKWATAEQGFIDQWGRFMTRSVAYIVAKEAGQILEKTGNPDSQELFSEDIY